jgi:hypothetical protein
MTPLLRATEPMHNQTLFLMLAIAAVLLPSSAAFGGPDGDAAAQAAGKGDETSRQQEVRAKGAQVMPFELDKTVHSFDKTDDGGIQRVRARGNAPDQVAMIRSHLQEIAQSFSSRDFEKPAHIHGTDMPGLAEMKAAATADLDVTYRALDDGAEIRYFGHTSEIVRAIHSWFDAQLRDHGRDATTSQAQFKLDALSWLAGSWINDDSGRRIEEVWTAPAADLMLGMSRTLSGDRTASFEFMRISVRADGVFYIAQPRGKPPVEFPLQSWDGAQAIFINPGNGDHLKRVIYRHNSDGSFTARIEGANQGAEFAEDYPYHRVHAAHVD